MYVLNGVNYGDLVECVTESGIEFYVDKFYLERLEPTLTVKGSVSTETHAPLYEHLHVEYVIDVYTSVDAYAKQRTDVVKLAEALGARKHRAVVVAGNVCLALFHRGMLVKPCKTLSDYYVDVDAESLANTALF